MAGHKLEHFQFSDPISKETASRTTRYRQLKKRCSDKYQRSVVPPEGFEVAEELIDGNESTETAESALTNSCIAASDNEANPSIIHGEDSDVNLSVDPVNYCLALHVIILILILHKLSTYNKLIERKNFFYELLK